MKALSFRRSVPRYAAVRLLAPRFPAAATGPCSCLRLGDGPPPELPGDDWLRVRPRLAGICGSDLATVTCQGSTYFSALTSFPFVLGHEIVGDVVAAGPRARGAPGERVVIEPALGCRVRAIDPPCAACAGGAAANCVNVTAGAIAAGVQTGYCRSTGGGWSEGLVAHDSQVHPLATAIPDEAAVLIEPLACAVHAVLRAAPADGDTALVVGAGSVGLLTLFALKRLRPGVRALVAARHPHQARHARDLGADRVVPAGRTMREAVIRETGARRHEPALGPSVVLGGVDVAFDCVGASATLDEAVRLTRARGTVVVVGMPARLDGIEGTALWFKETRVLGAYAYGLEPDGERTFAHALRLAAAEPARLASLVTHRFPLAGYRPALAVALRPGHREAVKTVFDLREGR